MFIITNSCVHFQAILLQEWTLPSFMCKFCPFISNLSVNVSVFTLIFISIDRYRGIMNPLSHRPRKLHSKILLIIIWIVSIFCAVPQAVFYSYEVVIENEKKTPFCSVTGDERKLKLFYIYNIFLVIIEYLLPLLVMSYTYTRMCVRLWLSVTPGQGGKAQDQAILANKKRVIMMLVTVVIIFCLCWLPYQIYFIVLLCQPSINQFKYINLIFLMSHWLAMSNSCYNPFIYSTLMCCEQAFLQK